MTPRAGWIAAAVAAAAIFGVACADEDGAEPARMATPVETPAETAVGAQDQAELGQQLGRRNGCLACHSTDGSSGVGPTWQGLFGSERPLADGSTVMADEAYLRESILQPNAKIAEGFNPGIMPQDFASWLSDDQINAVIAFIKTLR